MGCTNSSEEEGPNMLALNTMLQSKKQGQNTKKRIPPPEPDLLSETDPILFENEVSGNPESSKQIPDKQQPADFDQELMLFVSKVFKAYDKDRNGSLDVREFAQLIKENVHEGLNAEQVQKLLQALDNNHNQTIDQQELFCLFKTLIKP